MLLPSSLLFGSTKTFLSPTSKENRAFWIKITFHLQLYYPAVNSSICFFAVSLADGIFQTRMKRCLETPSSKAAPGLDALQISKQSDWWYLFILPLLKQPLP